MRYEIINNGDTKNPWTLEVNEKIVKSNTDLFDILTTIKEIELAINTSYKEG